jgi:hypothetical protein
MSDENDHFDRTDRPERRRNPLTSRLAFLVYGLLLATLVILGIRYTTYSMPHTHYHANMAVYIDDKREDFKNPQYYEEVALCSMHDKIIPKARVHMHNEENGVIHVHDEAVTWGQFFENIGWYVGPDFIRTPEKMYIADDTSKLHIMLNGQDLTDLSTITNEVINDKDRLLVSFGDIDAATLQNEYKTVPATAGTYDTRPDPAACSGDESPTVSERLKHLF